MQKSKKISHHNKKNIKTYFLYGKHAVFSALKNPDRKKIKLFASKKYHDELLEFANHVPIEYVDKNYFNDLFEDSNLHQEIALETKILIEKDLAEIINKKNSKSIIVILDQVTDPHNIGAILRSAAAFNADAVINSEHNSPQETPIMAKTACGALDIVPYIKAINISNVIKLLKSEGYWCYGLDGSAKYSFPTNLPEKVAIILGSEDTGIRRLVLENCDAVYKIDISNNMESLNVSNAASIILSKFYSS